MDYFEKQIDSKLMYTGRIVKLYSDTVELCSGRTAGREVVEHPGGVGIVPIDESGNVVAVRQFRYPVGDELLEIPAGKLEYGEDPYECAVRELSEETGYTAGEMVFLGMFYPSPGYCREKLYIYLALDLKAGDMHLDEDEYLNVERVPLDDFVRMIMDCENHDAKTIIGVLKAQKYLQAHR